MAGNAVSAHFSVATGDDIVFKGGAMSPPQTRWFVAFHILAVWLMYLAGTHFGALTEGSPFPVDSPVVMSQADRLATRFALAQPSPSSDAKQDVIASQASSQRVMPSDQPPPLARQELAPR
jgi:hypothetical protein